MKVHTHQVEEIGISAFKQGYSYMEYGEIMTSLVRENKSSGPKVSESLSEYTRLNLRRMKRWEKTLILRDEILQFCQNLTKPMNWLVITESWCGDAAHLIPIFGKMAALNAQIEMRMVWRDENPKLMDLYLTQGSRSIPKLVAFSPEDNLEITTWGPRPREAQQMVMDYKKGPQRPYSELQKELQIWYNKDKGQSSQLEFLEALKQGIYPK